MKKDIFNGKIKNEYYSYILIYMIFFVLLLVAVGALCIYAFAWGMASNTSGERVLIVAIGIFSFVLAFVYLFLELLVIRKYPQHQKLRRILFNSDIYFTDSTSNEYLDGSRTLLGRRNKAAFDMVTTLAEAEKRMGDKKPFRYTVSMVLSILFSVSGLVWLFGALLLLKKGAIYSNISDEIFLFLSFSVDFLFVFLAIIFFVRAYKIALMSPFENFNRKYELYSALVDISVRQNNKKHKFWYDIDQLEQIEKIVKTASENAELKLETKGKKTFSFTVVDTLNNSEIFTGYFL